MYKTLQETVQKLSAAFLFRRQTTEHQLFGTESGILIGLGL